jgi:hypothetical protein
MTYGTKFDYLVSCESVSLVQSLGDPHDVSLIYLSHFIGFGSKLDSTLRREFWTTTHGSTDTGKIGYGTSPITIRAPQLFSNETSEQDANQVGVCLRLPFVELHFGAAILFLWSQDNEIEVYVSHRNTSNGVTRFVDGGT